MTEEKIRILDEIIEQDLIYPVFQPVVSLKEGSVLGYEALSRFHNVDETVQVGIEELFQIAEATQRIWQLDYLCRKHAISKVFKGKDYQKLLFLNVSPGIMGDQRFVTGFTREYLKRFHASPDRIVFEITEREAVINRQEFQKLVTNYKTQDYLIAIDDAGSAYSGLERVCDVAPKYIKLDIDMVRNIHKSSIKSSLVKALVEFANSSNIKLIAEGIEYQEELEKLIEIGVHYGQGYFLARPYKELLDIDESVREMIHRFNFQNFKVQSFNMDQFYIKHVCTEVMTVDRNKKAGDLLDDMVKNPGLKGVCVLDQDRVLGMITREKFLQLLGGRYGFYMYQNKEIGSMMKQDFLCVDWEMSIGRVSEMAMEREDTELYDFIIVTRQDQYYGVVTVKDLLRKATQINVMTAREANPLTGLPGNVRIESEILNCLMNSKDYAVIYLDLDNFKAYNDVYGFENGDKVIKLLGDITSDLIGEGGFVGHIGGDDFVIVLHHCNYQNYIDVINQTFCHQVKNLYTREDVERGYILGNDRKGQAEYFPLVTVTIVAISSENRKFTTQIEISEELARLKKNAKKMKQILLQRG